jgi:hypothetical protein
MSSGAARRRIAADQKGEEMTERHPPSWLVVCCLVLTIGAIAALAQEESQPEMTPEMQAEMEAWMKLAEPGEHHAHLNPFVGRWKGAVKMWMAPETEPMLDEGFAEVSWILGGRYLEWRQTGEFGGMPFEGRAIEGFNNGDGRYEAVWIDNFGTLILFYTGSCSDDGKGRVMSTEFSDPVKGGTIQYKSVYRWIDDDHFLYEAFMDKGDGEFKSMEIAYERQ